MEEPNLNGFKLEESDTIEKEKIILKREWSFWENYESKDKKEKDYSKLLKEIYTFNDIISFWQFWNKYPGNCTEKIFYNGEYMSYFFKEKYKISAMNLFEKGIRPEWEDADIACTARRASSLRGGEGPGRFRRGSADCAFPPGVPESPVRKVPGSSFRPHRSYCRHPCRRRQRQCGSKTRAAALRRKEGGCRHRGRRLDRLWTSFGTQRGRRCVERGFPWVAPFGQGHGFVYWILISILVDIAAFIFFDLAFKKED